MRCASMRTLDHAPRSFAPAVNLERTACPLCQQVRSLPIASPRSSLALLPTGREIRKPTFVRFSILRPVEPTIPLQPLPARIVTGSFGRARDVLGSLRDFRFRPEAPFCGPRRAEHRDTRVAGLGIDRSCLSTAHQLKMAVSSSSLKPIPVP